MKLRYSVIKARESRTADIMVYGEIGGEINGNWMAEDIYWLNKEADSIVLHINSEGGSVMHGLSIVSALTACTVETTAIIEGIAASMAAVVALSCRRVKMNDFARLMIHSPFFADADGKKIKDLDSDDEKALQQIEALMKDILKRRGKSDEDILNIMRSETWYNAGEAVKEGFVDEIVATPVTGTSNLPVSDIAAIAAQTHYKYNDMDLRNINVRLGLAEDADEQAVIAEIDRREQEAVERKRKILDGAVSYGIKTGSIKQEHENRMRKLADTDFDLFIDLLTAPPSRDDGKRLSDLITAAMEGKFEEQPGRRTFDWYQKHDPKALRELERNDKASYDKLYREYCETL